MALNFEKKWFLSLKGADQKITFLDKSFFKGFSGGIRLIITDNGNNLPDLELVPLLPGTPAANQQFIEYSDKEVEKITKRFSVNGPDGFFVLYVRDQTSMEDTSIAMTLRRLVSGLDHNSVGPIQPIPPIPPKPRGPVGHGYSCY